jgi:hypothetical protein
MDKEITYKGYPEAVSGRRLGFVGDIVDGAADPKVLAARQTLKRALAALEVEYARLAVKRGEIVLQAAHDGVLFDEHYSHPSGGDLGSYTRRCELNLERARLAVREQELEIEESQERERRRLVKASVHRDPMLTGVRLGAGTDAVRAGQIAAADPDMQRALGPDGNQTIAAGMGGYNSMFGESEGVI